MPFMRPDMIRKAAMYCATFDWMTSQPAPTTTMHGGEAVEHAEEHRDAIHRVVVGC